MMYNSFHFFIWGLILCSSITYVQDEPPLIGDTSSGSRSNFVHVIPLLDEGGIQLTLEDDPPLPFSTKQTCALKCHSYDKITSGWHFNYMDVSQNPGRSGHPWIYADPQTGTQIPLSYRGWAGAYKPSEVGMSDWDFMKHFGRHLPGGGVGELQGDLGVDKVMRSLVSGRLEANCLACHDTETAHDQAKYAENIAKENFRWAATATAPFADVEGSSTELPDTYDYLMPDMLVDSKISPPSVHYQSNRFNHNQDVFIDVKREVPNERCYFCHTTLVVGQERNEKWMMDEDVHIAAGMKCVDCHCNGIDHNIVRGYEGEDEISNNPLAKALTCEGCHLGNDASIPTAGRLTAPVPQHKGIPPIHFENMACTSCHSGPWLGDSTQKVKTSFAHALGTHGVNKNADSLPHIITPVMARNANGKIAPHNLIYPSYWGAINGDDISPLSLSVINSAIQLEGTPHSPGDWVNVDQDAIQSQLQQLKSSLDQEPTFISGGMLYRLNDTNEIITEYHPSAEPYRWAVAHNVRPAAQSLGVRNCQDCHDRNADFFQSQVMVDSPVIQESTPSLRMVEFQELDEKHIAVFNASFAGRTYLKYVLMGSAGLLILIVLAAFQYGLQRLLFGSNQNNI